MIVTVVARANCRPICSGCEKAGPGYDTMKPRQFEFIPIWNIPVSFEYTVRRVDCPSCGVRTEKLPWASGKRTLTTVYIQFLAHWARKPYGFRTFRVTELSLYHSLGKLPEPEITHKFY